MRPSDPFEGIPAFLAVARATSFRAAAKELGVTAGAVSQSIRTLDRRVGLPLFQRTTRSVALTEAGASLFARLAPALTEVTQALAALNEMREVPAGQLRLTVPGVAVPLFVEPIVLPFRKRYPKVELEVSINDHRVDLAQDGFDAGIRLGEFVAKDMIGLRLSGALRWRIVGSPAYFAERGHPRTPRDLDKHELIRFRFGDRGGLPNWILTEKGRNCLIDLPRGIVVNDGVCALALARRGCGLAYVPDPLVKDEVAKGTLVTTLDAFMPTSSGFFLYFPSGSQLQPKLRAFIAVITEHLKFNQRQCTANKRTSSR